MNELFDTPQFKQQISKTANLMLDLLSYKIKPLDTFILRPMINDAWGNPTGAFFTFFPFDNSEQDQQMLSNLVSECIDLNAGRMSIEENEEQILHLMKTLIEKYSHKNDSRTLEEKMGAIFCSYESLEDSYIIFNTKILTALLQNIENKIKELEK